MSWPVSSSSNGKSMTLVTVVFSLVHGAMGGSVVCGAGGGVGRMVCECVWWYTGWYGVDWFPMYILCGMAGGAASVSNLRDRTGVCTGNGVGTGLVGFWASTLGASGGFSLVSGWMFCCGLEYGRIGYGCLGRKMSRMRVRVSNSLVCSAAGIFLMAHGRKFSAWTMRSSGVTVG